MKLRLEIWQSSENREERHFFIEGFQPTAYQQAPYVFGYNPQVISEEKIRRIKVIIAEPNGIWQKLDFGPDLP